MMEILNINTVRVVIPLLFIHSRHDFISSISLDNYTSEALKIGTSEFWLFIYLIVIISILASCFTIRTKTTSDFISSITIITASIVTLAILIEEYILFSLDSSFLVAAIRFVYFAFLIIICDTYVKRGDISISDVSGLEEENK